MNLTSTVSGHSRGSIRRPGWLSGGGGGGGVFHIIIGDLDRRLDLVELEVLLVSHQSAGRVLDVEERRGLALVVEKIRLRRGQPARDLALAVGGTALYQTNDLPTNQRVALRLPLVALVRGRERRRRDRRRDGRGGHGRGDEGRGDGGRRRLEERRRRRHRG